MMLKLTQAIASAKKVVAKAGEDFVYNPGGTLLCMYAPLGQAKDGTFAVEDDPRLTTGCLVGEILADNGMRTPVVAHFSGSVTSLVDAGEVSLSPKAARFLVAVQMHQDKGSTWGEALNAGIRALDI